MINNQSNKRAFNQYLSARNDFKHAKYKLAIKKLLPINLVTDNKDVNHLLVMSLYCQKDYQEAERILLQNINSYTSNLSLAKLMINVLLRNNEFIMCYEITVSFQDLGLKQWSLKRIKAHEQFIMANKAKLLSKLAKAFYHLSGVSLIRQRIILGRAQHLPLQSFVKIAKKLLIDPFLTPIMRLSILEILRKIGLHAKVQFRWIDKRIYSINVSQLLNLTKTKSYRKIMQVIDAHYFHNPVQMIALKQNLRLDLSYLYPFNDQKVKDISLWVKIAALRLQGKQPEFTNIHIKSIYFLQVKLNQLTKNLVK